jgi:RNA polymerase sigma-70 factor (ECF subfamily)
MVLEQDSLEVFIQKIIDGDEVAMADFYDLTVNRAYGIIIKIVLRPELAEEVIGDVYFQVWQQAGRYNPERSTPIGWLLMMCRSRALDKLRREKSATRNQHQENDQIEVEDEQQEVPLETILGTELSMQMSEALNSLNKNQRQTVTLAFYKGMTHQEISDYMGMPLGSVKSNINRAQAILRNSLSSDVFRVGEFYG